jgi:hypothetical protein
MNFGTRYESQISDWLNVNPFAGRSDLVFTQFVFPEQDQEETGSESEQDPAR